jgi:4-oxalocrotonate tautomerase family enzyme
MPVVKIDLLEGKSAKQKQALAMALLKAFEENGIPREWVSIIFNDNPAENWVVSGEMLSEKMKRGK